MSLSNLRIGYRLGIGFAFLVLMLFVVNILSISKLSQFQNSASDIVKEVYPQTVNANDLISTVNIGVVIYQRLLLITDENEIQRSISRIGELGKDINVLFEKLESGTTDERSLAALEEIKHIREKFAASGGKLINLILAGNQQEASDEFINNLNNLQREYRQSIAKLIGYQNDIMYASVDSMAEIYAETRNILLIILALGAAVGGVIAWGITRSVTHPIQEALLVAEKVAQGDLTSTITTTKQDETGQLLVALGRMNGSLRQIVSQVRDGAEAIASAASQIAAGNQDLSARTEEQASSLEQTASSMEELTSTIKNTSDNTLQATEIANQASATAQRSGEVMVSVTHKMRGIRDSSQRMADIIGVIDGIAFQTNILALNAAVEAARAGEQGRGFAVVAAEVRSLAQRSATAAKEIKELIDDSVGKIQDGMGLVDTAEETMNGLTAHVQGVNDIISEIAQASREQSDGINQINLAVGQIDTTTQQNAALVEESASAALSLQSQASALTQTVNAFKLNAQTSNSDSRQVNPQNNREVQALPASRTLAPAAGKASDNSSDWASF
ncbi:MULTISPECIES: methyl-accepting chemotaxis protein [unclassified Brenneria]|uniref:methyl-accepting chemotaxis protein n=1 Tax=unclassified Brenneria TaxID=2634434 RepID=UPI0018F0B69D|nr:methyl-accepting chemotaxis protein [Brenneria sp. L3-3C-1]MBJ7223748.1 MCP four helix bundle domain-containing protein [Brenneria sp. L3-3C-1]MEE3644991.1 methyl-accepting chemotaxis protein [Brenneria sp. L3_3C_1]